MRNAIKRDTCKGRKLLITSPSSQSSPSSRDSTKLPAEKTFCPIFFILRISLSFLKSFTFGFGGTLNLKHKSILQSFSFAYFCARWFLFLNFSSQKTIKIIELFVMFDTCLPWKDCDLTRILVNFVSHSTLLWCIVLK